MVTAAEERNANTGTGATCVISLGITEQIAQGRGAMQSQNEEASDTSDMA